MKKKYIYFGAAATILILLGYALNDAKLYEDFRAAKKRADKA